MTTSDPVRIIDQPIEVVITDPGGSQAFDSVTGGLVVIDVQHHEVHEGEMMTCHFSQAVVANNNAINIQITTPADKQVHFSASVGAGGLSLVDFLETPTTVNGAALAVFNMNRISANTPDSTALSGVTVNATGTILIGGMVIGGGTNPSNRVSGSARTGIEWVLEAGTNYVVRVTNTSGGNISLSIVAEFYEEPL